MDKHPMTAAEKFGKAIFNLLLAAAICFNIGAFWLAPWLGFITLGLSLVGTAVILGCAYSQIKPKP